MLISWKFWKRIAGPTKCPRGSTAAHGPRVWGPCHRHCGATIAFFPFIYLLWCSLQCNGL